MTSCNQTLASARRHMARVLRRLEKLRVIAAQNGKTHLMRAELRSIRASLEALHDDLEEQRTFFSRNRPEQLHLWEPRQ